MFDPEVETLAWEDQLALDDASFRAQLEYLRARSSFDRDRLAEFEGVRLTGDRRAAADREGRASRNADTGQSDRRASLRRRD